MFEDINKKRTTGSGNQTKPNPNLKEKLIIQSKNPTFTLKKNIQEDKNEQLTSILSK